MVSPCPKHSSLEAESGERSAGDPRLRTFDLTLINVCVDSVAGHVSILMNTHLTARRYRSYRIKKRICRLFQIFLTGRHCFVKIHLHSMFDSTRLINLSLTSVNKSVLDYCESDIMKCDAVL